ncbi:MAG: 23S rRNA (guanosine(2251)-2'-O)-methyltransferase RlmB [Acutalibacteraceae bacterium]|nr:23S rRNA (guanosine(2251)-2'-O)-methyltransferase RlmB [Acutalibacteraceae bacterium]
MKDKFENENFRKKNGKNFNKKARKSENKNRNNSDKKESREKNTERYADIIAGRNCVKEALNSGRAIESLLIATGSKSGATGSLTALAKEKGIPVKEVDSKKLDFMCGDAVHQGVVAMAAVKEYSTVEDIFETAEQRGEPPFIIILDEIEDPHNLGAIIRTAECTGAHGVIVPKRRSAGLSYTVGKSSAGAVEYVNVARVTNIPSVIDQLKERGVWVFGADMNGEDATKTDLTDAVAIVIGNEGKGIGRLVRSKCDGILSLPMKGQVNSLNASVAAGVLMYDVLRQRSK